MKGDTALHWLGDPPPCNSDVRGIEEDPNIILIIPYSHYYRVGGPPNMLGYIGMEGEIESAI